MSQITTHVLYTSTGLPAAGMSVRLEKPIAVRDSNESAIGISDHKMIDDTLWETIAIGKTDNGGRVSKLLKEGEILNPGTYRLVFESGNYFLNQGVIGFYPLVILVFETLDTKHYHVPLLLSPYGYSTYRGS